MTLVECNNVDKCKYTLGTNLYNNDKLYNYLTTGLSGKVGPMELTLRASEDGMSQVVKKFIDEHNHPLKSGKYIQYTLIKV